jgi:hypothetical protein
MSVPADERFCKTRDFIVADEGRKWPAGSGAESSVGSESSVISRQFSVSEMAAGEVEKVPDWEKFGYTTVVLVRVANTGLTGAIPVRVANKALRLSRGSETESEGKGLLVREAHATPRAVCMSIKRKGLREEAFA